MPPYFSVVIDNYNYGRFLAQAIESVLSQDFPTRDVEVILVDDGSTDGSREVAARFQKRIRAIFRENGGQAEALNAGIASATGEVIALLDADDWWREDKLRRVAERFDRGPTLGMVQHWMEAADENGRRLSSGLPDAPDVYEARDFLEGRALFTGTSGLSLRRSAAAALLPIPRELRISADSYLYRLILDAPVGNIREPLGFRRIHGSNRYAARRGDVRRMEEHVKAMEILRRDLDRRLAARGLRLSEPAERGMRLEELRENLILRRCRGDIKGAFEAWKEAARSSPRSGYGLFKAATLLLAVVWPPLYFLFYRLYSRFPAVARMRSRALPFGSGKLV